jgi:hypothetical protein
MDKTSHTTPPHITTGLRVLAGLVLMAGIFFGGVYIGYANRPATDKIVAVVNKESAVTTKADFDSFWKAWQIVESKLPEADKTTSQERIYGAIKGMLASFGDPYTTFFPTMYNSIHLHRWEK